MPRGGARKGRPGGNYPNRVDLRDASKQAPAPVRTVPSQGYGQRAAQERQQQAVPMAGPVDLPRVRPEPPSLSDPTGRPDEPIFAGAPIGPGPGPEALAAPTTGPAAPDDGIAAELRALYMEFPSEELRELIEDLDNA